MATEANLEKLEQEIKRLEEDLVSHGEAINMSEACTGLVLGEALHPDQPDMYLP